MRFMMLMIPAGYATAAAGTMPSAEAVAAMMKYNEALKDAGVLITLDGLHPPSMGARVSFPGGKPVVTDGPFTEAKEVLGGYWMIDVTCREEAIAWAKRCRLPGAMSSKSAGFRRCRIFLPMFRRRRPDLPNCRAGRSAKAFSSEVGTGSREENASEQKTRAPERGSSQRRFLVTFAAGSCKSPSHELAQGRQPRRARLPPR
jgi:hypothetical protein